MLDTQIDCTHKIADPAKMPGVLTLTWYMCMCLPSGAVFHEIWFSYGGGGGHQS